MLHDLVYELGVGAPHRAFEYIDVVVQGPSRRSDSSERWVTAVDLLLGLLVNWDGRLCPYAQMYADILRANDISYRLLDSARPGFVEQARGVSHLLFRHSIHDTDNLIGDTVVPFAEKTLGVPCLPSSLDTWHYDDKLRQMLLLNALGAPAVDSWSFTRLESALDWLRGAELPLVAKLPKSAGSENVFLITSRSEGCRLVRRVFGRGLRTGDIRHRVPHEPDGSAFAPMEALRIGARRARRRLQLLRGTADQWALQKDRIVFQGYLIGNEYDTRVTVLGHRAFGFRRFNRPGDFRASGSGLVDWNPAAVDPEAVSVALDVAQRLPSASMTFDLLRDRRGDLRIVEMSYSFMAEAVHRCPGYWDGQLAWHAEQQPPQYWQLCDLLGMPDLRPQ